MPTQGRSGVLMGKNSLYIWGEHSMLWYALNEVSVLDVETGETDFVTKVFDRNTYMPKWSENGEKYLLYS